MTYFVKKGSRLLSLNLLKYLGRIVLLKHSLSKWIDSDISSLLQHNISWIKYKYSKPLGLEFINQDGRKVGTMTEYSNEEIDHVLNVKGYPQNVDNIYYPIPNGYHYYSGYVSIEPEAKTVTPTKSAQDITPTDGKVLFKDLSFHVFKGDKIAFIGNELATTTLYRVLNEEIPADSGDFKMKA